ncbi:MAG: peroxiredoxin [Polyangiaceae bacterium]|nr:peroxiredoxin [Polyangiaceae bacterium]
MRALHSIALCVFLLGGCSSGELLAPGSTAPDRTLRDQTGASRSLASFRGKPLVLYFYPKDATPGCTREACAFRDSWSRYESAGVQIVGVSTDSVESHAEFAEEHQLPFPLLADVDGELTEAFGVRTRLGMASRVTFVLDKEGVVRAIFRDVDPGVHAADVLAEIERLGLVTPASSL